MVFSFSAPSKVFKQKVIALRPSLVSLAYSWCGDSMLADDLTQDAITNALEKNIQLKDINKIKCWLFTILNNCWRDYLRKKKETIDLDDLIIPSEKNIELDISTQQTVERVRLAVSKLPLGQRQVITLIDLHDLSYAEVALTLEIPSGTVMSRLSRARASLKNSLLSYHKALNPYTTLRIIK